MLPQDADLLPPEPRQYKLVGGPEDGNTIHLTAPNGIPPQRASVLCSIVSGKSGSRIADKLESFEYARRVIAFGEDATGKDDIFFYSDPALSDMKAFQKVLEAYGN